MKVATSKRKTPAGAGNDQESTSMDQFNSDGEQAGDAQDAVQHQTIKKKRFTGCVKKYDPMFPGNVGGPVTMEDVLQLMVLHTLANAHVSSGIKEKDLRLICCCANETYETLFAEYAINLKAIFGWYPMRIAGFIYLVSIVPTNIIGTGSPSEEGQGKRIQWCGRCCARLYSDGARPRFTEIPASAIFGVAPISGKHLTWRDHHQGAALMPKQRVEVVEHDAVTACLDKMAVDGWLATEIRKRDFSDFLQPQKVYRWGPRAIATVSPQLLYDTFTRFFDSSLYNWDKHKAVVAKLQYQFYDRFYEMTSCTPPGGRGSLAPESASSPPLRKLSESSSDDDNERSMLGARA